MNAVELARKELKELFPSLEESEAELRDLYRISQEFLTDYQEFGMRYKEVERNINLNERIIEKISKRIRELNNFIETNDKVLISNINDYKIISNDEFGIIVSGIKNRADLNRVEKEAIEFKKLYPGWKLVNVTCSGYSPEPELNPIYKFKYRTPTGHYMIYDNLDTSTN
jgi:chromosome segregation ATPase